MTRAETIRLALTDQILSGQRLPGSALDESELARSYGASRTPVREALRQLAASGLVVHRPHRGAVIALPSDQMLSDMFQIMNELEGLCAEYAARSMTFAQRDDLVAIHAQMASMVSLDDRAAYASANEVFHARIYEGGHNAYLAELTLQTRQRLQPFRRAQFLSSLGRLVASHQEHEAVVQAILRGDHANARLAMMQHIVTVRDVYLSMPAPISPGVVSGNEPNRVAGEG